MRLTYSHSVTKPVNMTHCKWRNSCIGILICSEYGFKHNLHQIKKLCIYAWLTVYLYWIWTGNMTRE